MVPCGERILAKLLALFLAIHILLDSFAHDPVWRSAASRGKALDTGFHPDVEFEAGCRGLLHKATKCYFLLT